MSVNGCGDTQRPYVTTVTGNRCISVLIEFVGEGGFVYRRNTAVIVSGARPRVISGAVSEEIGFTVCTAIDTGSVLKVSDGAHRAVVPVP